jgi:alkyl hydroperoxide reductase subunit AhpC
MPNVLLPLLLSATLLQSGVRPVSNPIIRGALAPEEGVSLSVPDKQPERTLRIGDDAPPLSVQEWIDEGKPAPPRDGFRPGTAYVLVFFTPTTRPIKPFFDSVSNLSDRFTNRMARVIGVSGDGGGATREDLATVLKAYGANVRFPIAWDDATKSRDAYLVALGGQNVPLVVVVDPRGRIAWYGSPGQTTQILNAVLSGQWDLDSVRDQVEHTEDMAWMHIEIIRAQRAKDPKRMLAAGERLGVLGSRLGEAERQEMLDFADAVCGRSTVFNLTQNLELARLARDLAYRAASDESTEPRVLAVLARTRFATGDKAGAISLSRKALEILGSKVPTDVDLLDDLKRDFERFSA